MQALTEKHLVWLQPALARYGLTVLSAAPLSSRHRDTFSSYKVETSEATVFVKLIPRQAVGLESLEQRLKQLTNSGFTAMPRYYQTLSGRFVATLGKSKVIVSDWVAGESFPGPGPAIAFTELGKSLAQLHHIGAPAYQVFDIDSQINRHRQLHRRFLMTLSHYDNPENQWLAQHSDECIEMAETGLELIGQRSVRQFLERERTSPKLIHSAVTRHNLTLYRGRPLLLNWHNLRPGCTYAEAAESLASTTNFRLKAIQALMQGYEDVRLLQREERQLIFAFFSFPYDAMHILRRTTGVKAEQQLRQVAKDWQQRRAAWSWLREWANGNA